MTYAEGAGVWRLIAVCLIVLMFISSSLNKIVLITLCLFSIRENVTKQFPITFSVHNPAPTKFLDSTPSFSTNTQDLENREGRVPRPANMNI